MKVIYHTYPLSVSVKMARLNHTNNYPQNTAHKKLKIDQLKPSCYSYSVINHVREKQGNSLHKRNISYHL